MRIFMFISHFLSLKVTMDHFCACTSFVHRAPDVHDLTRAYMKWKNLQDVDSLCIRLCFILFPCLLCSIFYLSVSLVSHIDPQAFYYHKCISSAHQGPVVLNCGSRSLSLTVSSRGNYSLLVPTGPAFPYLFTCFH